MLIDGGEIDYALGQEFLLSLKSLFSEIGTRVLKTIQEHLFLLKMKFVECTRILQSRRNV